MDFVTLIHTIFLKEYFKNLENEYKNDRELSLIPSPIFITLKVVDQLINNTVVYYLAKKTRTKERKS